MVVSVNVTLWFSGIVCYVVWYVSTLQRSVLPPQFLSRGLRQYMSVNVDIYVPSDTGRTPHDHLAEHTIVANSVLVHVFCCTQSLFVSHI